MINYVSIDELISEHKASLYSYYDAGLDDGLLYGYVVRCLGLIGVKILPIKETILTVENYGVDLPDDFNSLICLHSCQKIQYETPIVHGQISYEKAFCHVEPCMSENSYNHNEYGRYKNIYVFEKDKYEVTNTNILVVGNKIQGCVNPFNQKRYDAEIKNNQVLTQFQEGNLFLIYRSKITEGEIMIPNYPEIINWLLAEMETLALRNVLLNTTSDVVQRYNLVKSELHIHKQNAIAFWKRNELQDFFNLRSYWNYNFKKLSRK